MKSKSEVAQLTFCQDAPDMVRIAAQKSQLLSLEIHGFLLLGIFLLRKYVADIIQGITLLHFVLPCQPALPFT